MSSERDLIQDSDAAVALNQWLIAKNNPGDRQAGQLAINEIAQVLNMPKGLERLNRLLTGGNGEVIFDAAKQPNNTDIK
jgi:hypothetical protein